MRTTRFLAITLGCMATLAVTGGPALAAAPVVIQGNGPVHREIPGFMTCGSVSLDYVLDAKRTITETYTADGTQLSWVLHARYFATLTDSVSGIVVRDDGARAVFDDYVLGTTTGVGGVHHLTWPGDGMVFGAAGRDVWDWNGTPPAENEDDDVRVFEAGLRTAFESICSIFD